MFGSIVMICQKFMEYNSQWIIISRQHTMESCPSYNKEHDYGGFCCMYADCISNDCDLNFSNENIEQKRQFIKETIETDNYINID